MSEPTKITQKVVGYKVIKPGDQVVEPEKVATVLETMKRPEYLGGGTYKIKPPAAEHAIYLSMTDIVVVEL